MKRMVENSEKIEKLLDEVYDNGNEIYFNKKALLDYGLYSGGDSQFDGNVEFYNELRSSNITTRGGTKIDIIDEEKYGFSASTNASLTALNLGTAIVVTGSIEVGTENGEQEIMTFNTDNMEPTNLVQLTGEPVCTLVVDTNNTTHTKTIKLILNKAVAEYPVADVYRFSFIFGRYGKEI